MADSSKGDGLMAEAEAMLNQSTGGCCGKGRSRVEEACMLYVRAGNAFKVAKEWAKAGNAFSEAANYQLENERKTEAGMNYVEAAKCYKKVSATDSERCLIKASEVYDDMGRGKTAAKQHLTLAELYEEQGNLQRAIEEYQRAADTFSGEELASSTTKCQNAIANHSATLGNYSRAQELFEDLGSQSLSNKLLKYTANENFAKAGLCQLAANPQDGQALLRKVDEYREISPSFGDSRECLWLTNMAEAVQSEDVDAFNEAIRKHESISKLSEWDHHLLKQIRRQIGPDLR